MPLAQFEQVVHHLLDAADHVIPRAQNLLRTDFERCRQFHGGGSLGGAGVRHHSVEDEQGQLELAESLARRLVHPLDSLRNGRVVGARSRHAAIRCGLHVDPDNVGFPTRHAQQTFAATADENWWVRTLHGPGCASSAR